MKKDKMYEIRRLLGDRFHLSESISFSENKAIIDEWHLYRKYADMEVYFSKDNEEIMSSETNTIDELYEYAKKHHKIDVHMVLQKIIILMSNLFLIICFFNIIFIRSRVINGIVIGADVVLIIINLIRHHIWSKNWEVDMLELYENFKKISNEK